MTFAFRICLAITLCLNVTEAQAEESYLRTLIVRADELELASRAEWLALHYYQRRGDGWLSQTHDPGFFSSGKGSAEPATELKAALEAYFNPDVSLGDLHPQCHFPARLAWLSRELSIDSTKLPAVNCKSFVEWRQSLQAAGVSVIFPAAYLNNPSSMFGHTFLRIDRRDQTDQTRLLAYSIGYAADVAPDSNPISYIYRGLFGGYPGTFTGAPYYDKVIEYGDIEARDIWEYELNLTQGEVDQLVRHAWELQHVRFPYYFFDENCSYRLLMLLEIARPGLSLAHEFDLYAIPADTIRALERHQLIRGKHYRPAAVTRVLATKATMNVPLQKMAYRLAHGQQAPDAANLEQLDDMDKARVLDLAYEYSRYLAQESGGSKDFLASVSLGLLRARSRLVAVPEVSSPGQVPVSPENGHSTARFEAGAGSLDGNEFLSFRLRPAFHDVLDDDRGYTPGAQINFLDFELRHYPAKVPADGEEWDLEYVELVGIKSFALRDRFFKPYSWEVSAGWKRMHELAEDTMRFSADGAWGISYGLPDRVFFYGLAGAGIRSSPGLLDDYEGSLLGKIGMLWEVYGNSKLKFELERREYEGPNISDGDILRIQFNQVITNNAAIRLEYEDFSLSNIDFTQTHLGWRRYF